MKIYRRQMPRQLIILLGASVLLAALVYFGLQLIRDKLMDATMFHRTTATVTKKEHVKFDEKNHSYITDLGKRIEVRPGEEQWRVYYEFDNFDQFEEPFRSQLMELEKKRLSQGRPRFWFKNFNDRSWYDSVEIGDKLDVSYRPFSDGEIEVASVTKANGGVK